jgi:hypothetical protein
LLVKWEKQDRIIGPSLRRVRHWVAILWVVGLALSLPSEVLAGSARDYLNAPIDSWFALYNGGYAASVTPEDGLDVTARIRTNVASQSLVLTRTMDYWGRTGGVSVVLPYLYVESSSGSDLTAVRGVSDIGLRGGLPPASFPLLIWQEVPSREDPPRARKTPGYHRSARYTIYALS